MQEFLKKKFEESIQVKKDFLCDLEKMKGLQAACELAVKCYKAGGKLMVAGNGGSAADAQHIVAELVSRFYIDRPGLPALALTTDTSILTAVGNDYGYEDVFSRQVEANGAAGDLFLAISTSGNSPNIIKAIQAAQDKGIPVIGLTGQGGGKMAELCEICIQVPSKDTPRVQEVHILIGHILCDHIEQVMFG